MRRLALLAALVLSIAIGFTCAAAAPVAKERDQAREKAILAELEVLAPDSVSGFVAATKALDAREWEKAADGYRRVLERAPGFDAATRRLGSCLVESGQRAGGIRLLESALETRKSSANAFSLGLALSRSAGTGDEKPERGDLVRALGLMDEAARMEPSDPDPLLVKAQVSLDLQELDRLREAVGLLQKKHPDLLATHYFAAVRAAIEEEWREAEREIREAGRLGLPQEEVERFLSTGVASRAAAWRWAVFIACAAGLWALGLVALFVLGHFLSAATLASIERVDPNESVSPSSMRLRSIYRRVVTVAGYYWYLSQPFVALLVVAAAAAVLYGFLVIGRIPIKLVAILVIGTLVSLFAIVRSLFVRVRDDDPGRPVREDEAPALWATARDVAAQVGTRPVDEIWMTPGTDLAVMERGGARARLEDRGRRALILGAGVLDGFRQGPFRAVLAHEYGHFAHRDTAGGDVALRVTSGMQTFAVALARAGFAVWWNLAFQFLRLYDFLFRRISHGATRLQEVLADRVAIQRYGLEAFREGLTHVVRRSVVFERVATAEIDAAIEQERRISNLYLLPPPSDEESASALEERIASQLSADTDADSTHPSPKDRFRLGQRISSSAGSTDFGGIVWDLFRDPAALQAELTAAVASRIETAAS